MSEESKDATATPDKPKRSKGKALLLIVVLLVVALLLLVALLPTFISAGVGRGTIMGVVNGSIRGTASVDGLSVGWFSGLEITSLELADEHGETVLTADSIDAPDAGLFGLVMGSNDLGTITITRPNATLVQDDEGIVNIQRAIESPEPQPASDSSGSNYNLKLVIVDGQGSFSGPNLPTAWAKQIESTIALSGMSAVSVSLSTNVEQEGQTGSPGSVKLDADITEMSDANGQFNLNNAVFDITADVAKLPVSVIDVASGQDGQLVAMIGPMLDANVSAKGSLSDLTADLNATAERLNAQAKVTSSDSQLVVSPDSRVVVTVTPEAWQTMSANNAGEGGSAPAELTSQFDINLTVAELTVPKSGSRLSWDRAAVNTKFAIGNIDLRTPGPIGQLTLANTQANLAFQASQLKFDVNAVGVQGTNRGQLSLEGTITGLVADNGDLRLLQTGDKPLMSYLTGKIQGAIDQFPIAVIDQILDQNNIGQQILGDNLNAKLVWNLGGETSDNAIPGGTFKLTADSPRMPSLSATMAQQGEVADLSWKIVMQGVNIASLAGNSSVEPMVTEVLGERVNGEISGEGKLDWSVYESSGALAAINADFKLDVAGTSSHSLKATGSLDGKQISLNATASLPNLNVARVIELQSAEDEAQAVAEGATSEYIQLVGQMLNLQFNSEIVIALINGQLPEAPASAMSGNMTLTAKNQQTDIDIKGVIDNGVATLNNSKLAITLTPTYVETMTASDAPSSEDEPATLALVEPTPLVVTIDELQVDLAAETSGPMPIAATVTSPKMIFMTSSAPEPVTLNAVSIKIPKTDMQEPFPVNGATALTYQGKQAGNVTLDAITSQTPAGYVIEGADLIWSNPSVALIDAVSSGGGKIAAILQGGVDQMKVAVKGDPRTNATFVATSQGKALNANLPGSISEELMSVENGNVTLTITPEAYVRYQTTAPENGGAAPEPAAWQLAEAANLTLDITTFTSPREASPASGNAETMPASPQANGGAMTASLKSDALRFSQGAGKQGVSIRNMRVDLSSQNISDHANAEGGLDVVLTPVGGQPINGKLTLSAQASGLASETGRSINAIITGDQLPTAMLDALAGQDNLFANAIGQIMTLNVVANQQGEQPGVATIDVKGDNAAINVPGRLEPDGRLVLAEDAKATFNVTPQLGQSLARLNPVLLQVRSGEKPVEAVIQKGAVLYSPNADENATAISSISAMTAINLNELVLEEGGLLGTALQALKLSNPGKTYAVQFKPMSFKLDQGVLSYAEPLMMALGSNTNLGFDGNVNLVNKNLGLNMLVPPETMQRALGDDFDASGSALRVPVTGTYDAPKLDSGKLVEAVAGYSAKAAIQKEVGGAEGKIIGGVIDGIFKPKDQKQQQNVNEESTSTGSGDSRSEKEAEDKDVLGGFLKGVLQNRKEKNEDE